MPVVTVNAGRKGRSIRSANRSTFQTSIPPQKSMKCAGGWTAKAYNLTVYAISDTSVGHKGRNMCISPEKIFNKNTRLYTLTECRYCWQCKANRINDWVGRCIAESKSATQTLSITLTYAGGEHNPHASVLVYSDVQKLFKRLRKAGYVFRYIVAGEYGSKKGRAHWHLILFMKGKNISVEYGKNVTWEFWNHDNANGHSFFEEPSYHAYRYILKYIQKDREAAVSVGHFAMSKKPPLGSEYWHHLAKQYVQAGLVPRDPSYSFPENPEHDGALRQYWLTGRSLDLYLDRVLTLWGQLRPNKKRPYSKLVDQYEDKKARYHGLDNMGSVGDFYFWNTPDFDILKPPPPGKDWGWTVLKTVGYPAGHRITRYSKGWYSIGKERKWQGEIVTRRDMKRAVLGRPPSTIEIPGCYRPTYQQLDDHFRMSSQNTTRTTQKQNRVFRRQHKPPSNG